MNDSILKVLRRGPRKGLPAEIIAQRAGTKLSSTRTVLATLKRNGQIVVVGTESREFRPAQLYAVAS